MLGLDFLVMIGALVFFFLRARTATRDRARTRAGSGRAASDAAAGLRRLSRSEVKLG